MQYEDRRNHEIYFITFRESKSYFLGKSETEDFFSHGKMITIFPSKDETRILKTSIRQISQFQRTYLLKGEGQRKIRCSNNICVRLKFEFVNHIEKMSVKTRCKQHRNKEGRLPKSTESTERNITQNPSQTRRTVKIKIKIIGREKSQSRHLISATDCKLVQKFQTLLSLVTDIKLTKREI